MHEYILGKLRHKSAEMVIKNVIYLTVLETVRKFAFGKLALKAKIDLMCYMDITNLVKNVVVSVDKSFKID